MSSKNQRPDRRARAEQMRKERERAAKRRRNGITIGIVVVVVALIAVAGFGIYQATEDDAEAGSTPSGATSDGGFVVDQKALTGESSGDAPVDVVLYEDFQCPGCKAFETSTRSIVDQYIKDGTINVEYRPLNFIDGNMGGQTEYSLKSANAAICVYEEAGAKAFYELHTQLFDNQMEEGGPGFTDQQYEDFAGEVGADGVGSCISDMPYGDFVKDTTKAFLKEGYSSTPTILVDGEALKGESEGTLPTPDAFKAAIDKAAQS
ncbi:DsbA family protein [Solicola gregarius]|uniref:DsbA family protein n=1 Tax=Solicola gregarius TaxID=2908642 RepID=A0AA46TG50_9ACTN|nr:thioredoxin domain-containing protein [Solicola gregarius]UYM04234.1 DsbA family protein [Solicola gregarius]